IQDLHPHDRGPKGTHDGAIIANGNLYCPGTPRPLPELGPLTRTATREQAADWERQTAELARHKLGRITRDDADGYHRVACAAAKDPATNDISRGWCRLMGLDPADAVHHHPAHRPQPAHP